MLSSLVAVVVEKMMEAAVVLEPSESEPHQ
jgi:hypothetical protein